MKKNTFYVKRVLNSIGFVFILLCLSSNSQAQRQFKIRNDGFIQIGYDSYKTLSFGKETNSPNNGRFAIEYWDSYQGLNFWRPWPTANYGDFSLFLRSDGNVGIGSSGDASYKLRVEGQIYCTGINTSSDKRFKSNIQPLSGFLNKILLLKPVTYDFASEVPKYDVTLPKEKDDVKIKTMQNDKVKSVSGSRTRLVAQDVQTVLPQLVAQDAKGYLSINYTEIIPLLINAIQDQQAQIEALKVLIAKK